MFQASHRHSTLSTARSSTISFSTMASKGNYNHQIRTLTPHPPPECWVNSVHARLQCLRSGLKRKCVGGEAAAGDTGSMSMRWASAVASSSSISASYNLLNPSEPQSRGRQRGVTPIFFLFRFPRFRFLPICAPCFRELLGPPAPRVAAVKKTLFGTVWKMSRIFVNFIAAIFPGNWRTKICKNFRQKFRRIFRRSLTKISRELRSGGMRAQGIVPICSVFFRFVPICLQSKSEQIRETPSCRPLLQIPESIFCIVSKEERITKFSYFPRRNDKMATFSTLRGVGGGVSDLAVKLELGKPNTPSFIELAYGGALYLGWPIIHP